MILIPEDIVMKSEKKIYVIFSIIFSPGIIMVIHSLYNTSGNYTSEIGVLLFIFIFVFRFYLYKIIITERGIFYRSIFNYREALWEDVIKYRTDFNVSYKTPSMALKIFTKDSKKEPKIIINIKPFSRNDLKLLYGILDKVVMNTKK